MLNYEKPLNNLLTRAEKTYSDPPLSKQVKKAFSEIPRHKFIPIFRQFDSNDWITINDNNLKDHLLQMYEDFPLVIYGCQEDFKQKVGTTYVSTISQPSFVLKMIDMLKLEAGHKVYELGCGSGWNAALMGHVVGATGKVISVEIIPELVKRARKCISKIGMDHVTVIEGDGGDGVKNEAPFDRAIFTAGAFDLPQSFYSQIKEGGLLLFVLKNKGGGDSLLLMEKKNDHFEAMDSMSCGFVPVTGKYHIENMEAISLNHLIEDMGLEEVESTPFYWSGCQNHKNFVWKTQNIRSFLTITEPLYESIELENNDTVFGIVDRNNKSIMVAHHDKLISYGSKIAKEHFLSKMNEWINIGMPAISNLKVRAYPIDKSINLEQDEWLIKRKESQFVWRL